MADIKELNHTAFMYGHQLYKNGNSLAELFKQANDDSVVGDEAKTHYQVREVNIMSVVLGYVGGLVADVREIKHLVEIK
jgi:hypothetical protein